MLYCIVLEYLKLLKWAQDSIITCQIWALCPLLQIDVYWGGNGPLKSAISKGFQVNLQKLYCKDLGHLKFSKWAYDSIIKC